MVGILGAPAEGSALILEKRQWLFVGKHFPQWQIRDPRKLGRLAGAGAPPHRDNMSERLFYCIWHKELPGLGRIFFPSIVCDIP